MKQQGMGKEDRRFEALVEIGPGEGLVDEIWACGGQGNQTIVRVIKQLKAILDQGQCRPGIRDMGWWKHGESFYVRFNLRFNLKWVESMSR